MSQISTKIDDEGVRAQLQKLAEEVATEISELDPARSKELLGIFVSELFVSVTEQERRELRRQRQAEGIAAARARGVRFGRAKKPLPENFIQCYKAWQEGQMTAAQAAEACGITKGAFYNATYRVRQAENCPV